MFSLNGKNTIVTGAGSGIGQSTAIAFAKQGAHVSVLEINLEAANETVEKIRTNGGQAEATECDVTHHDHVQDVFDKIATDHGGLDCLINNAGIAHVGNILNTNEKDFDRVMNVNLKGVFNCLKGGVRQMVKSGGGAIVNIASTVATMAINDRLAYSTSKGGVLAMTYSVAKDHLHDKIRCNAIQPGRIHTPFVDGFIAENYPKNQEEIFRKLSDYQPIGRMGKPEEVAAMAVFLCSDEASFITGSPFAVDGGTLYVR
ncbi:MAG: SDR family oxidoreductase [Verrucomicrobiota bacterium]|nr:SDR family oxidoreductase [Verrucomicrobiota bacterium]MEE2615826.1 SDR family oxidoreductase [Verrucomicrobiota bacterium]